jgi:hypothetical protein
MSAMTAATPSSPDAVAPPAAPTLSTPPVPPPPAAPWPYPPAAPWPYPPAAPGFRINPLVLVIGVIALAVVVAGAAFVVVNKNSGPGGIAFSPPTISCSGPNSGVLLIRLPSSVKAGDMLTWQLDGVTVLTDVVEAEFEKQADGTWLMQGTTKQTIDCQKVSSAMPSGANDLIGTHEMTILDAGGNVLAEGSFTLAP